MTIFYDEYEDLWECVPCRFSFDYRWQLNAHLETASQHSWCMRCERDFSSFNAREQHWRHSSAHNLCGLCDMDYSRYEDLLDHELEEHNGCQLCRSTFSVPYQLAEHLAQTHSYCVLCHLAHPNAVALDEHKVTIHHWCLPCGRSFQNVNNLRQHQNSHKHADKAFMCPMRNCSARFVSLSALISHAEGGRCASGVTRRDVDQLVVRADINGVITDRKMIQGPDNGGVGSYPFGDQSCYQATELTWNGHAYECYLCHKSFRQLRDLNAHLASPAHNGAKIYHCPPVHGCGAKFTTLSALMRHIEDDANGCGVKRFRFVERAIQDNVNMFSKAIM